MATSQIGNRKVIWCIAMPSWERVFLASVASLLISVVSLAAIIEIQGQAMAIAGVSVFGFLCILLLFGVEIAEIRLSEHRYIRFTSYYESKADDNDGDE